MAEDGVYEAVHAHPDGQSTVSRMALTAREYGFDGLVIRNHGDSPASYDPPSIREKYDLDVVSGVEIRARDPSRAGGFVGSHRENHEIILVHGGDPTINRFAVEQPAVDVLAHPMVDDGDFNHVLAKEARKNGVRIEFNLSRVLRLQGGKRVQALQDLGKLQELVEAFDVEYVVSADPHSHLQLRAPRELTAVGEMIGFTEGAIETGLQEWGVIAERNRDRLSAEFIEPGIRRVSGGDNDGEESSE